MPVYRVQTRDGTERTVRASRLRTDRQRLYLDEPADGRWQTVLQVDFEDLRRVRRRLDAPDGGRTWVTEHPHRPRPGSPR